MIALCPVVSCFRKKLTVIGIIGKTHGVKSVTKPQMIPCSVNDQSVSSEAFGSDATASAGFLAGASDWLTMPFGFVSLTAGFLAAASASLTVPLGFVSVTTGLTSSFFAFVS